MILGKVICVVLYNLLLTVLIKAFLCGYFDILRFLHFTKKPDSQKNQVFKWCHQESNILIQNPKLQHFNIFGKIPEPLNQPYAKFTNFR